jgi:hypothetical protein
VSEWVRDRGRVSDRKILMGRGKRIRQKIKDRKGETEGQNRDGTEE